MATWTVYKEEKSAALPILRTFSKGEPVAGYEAEAQSLMGKIRGRIDNYRMVSLSQKEVELLRLMLKLYPVLYESEPAWIRNPTRPEDW